MDDREYLEDENTRYDNGRCYFKTKDYYINQVQMLSGIIWLMLYTGVEGVTPVVNGYYNFEYVGYEICQEDYLTYKVTLKYTTDGFERENVCYINADMYRILKQGGKFPHEKF